MLRVALAALAFALFGFHASAQEALPPDPDFAALAQTDIDGRLGSSFVGALEGFTLQGRGVSGGVAKPVLEARWEADLHILVPLYQTEHQSLLTNGGSQDYMLVATPSTEPGTKIRVFGYGVFVLDRGAWVPVETRVDPEVPHTWRSLGRILSPAERSSAAVLETPEGEAALDAARAEAQARLDAREEERAQRRAAAEAERKQAEEARNAERQQAIDAEAAQRAARRAAEEAAALGGSQAAIHLKSLDLDPGTTLPAFVLWGQGGETYEGTFVLDHIEGAAMIGTLTLPSMQDGGSRANNRTAWPVRVDASKGWTAATLTAKEPVSEKDREVRSIDGNGRCTFATVLDDQNRLSFAKSGTGSCPLLLDIVLPAP